MLSGTLGEEPLSDQDARGIPRMIRRLLLAVSVGQLTVGLFLFTSGTVNAAPGVGQKCAIAKINAVKAKYACLTAQSVKAILGKTPNTAACANAFSKAFARAEAAAGKRGGSCLTMGDVAAIEQRVDANESSTAVLLGGLCTAAADVSLEGQIMGISAPELTVGTTTIATDSQTVYAGDGDPKSLADLHAGDLVAVCANKQADGSILAVSITRLPPAQ